MIKPTATARLHSGLELTPLIDIVFIVVVFLLLTANARLLPLPVDLPSAASSSNSEATKPATVTVTLQREQPIWAIDQQSYPDWESFSRSLQQQLQETAATVNIAAGKDAEVEPLLRLLTLLKQQQISHTQILMDEQQ